MLEMCIENNRMNVRVLTLLKSHMTWQRNDAQASGVAVVDIGSAAAGVDFLKQRLRAASDQQRNRDSCTGGVVCDDSSFALHNYNEMYVRSATLNVTSFQAGADTGGCCTR